MNINHKISITALLFAVFIVSTPSLAQNTDSYRLIRGSESTVYLDVPGTGRFVFPNFKTYSSWFNNFDSVVTISDQELSQISLKGNVTYKPEMKLVKIQTSPTVYLVGQGGYLRPIANEETAIALYGENWNKYIDDIPDAFFTDYTIGQPIQSSDEYKFYRPADYTIADDVVAEPGSWETKSGFGEEGQTDQETDRLAFLPSCGSDTEFFSVAPLKSSDYVSFSPLGGLNPPAHVFPSDHGGYYLVNPDVTRYGPSVNIVSPGNMWVTNINSVEHLSSNPVVTDYDITLYPCKELKIVFGHIVTLPDKLISAMENLGDCFEYVAGGDNYRKCQSQINVEILAGEFLGTAGGGMDRYGLDFGAFDSRAAIPNYANPGRWYEEKRHAVCVLDYFKEDVKNQLKAKTGSPDGKLRTIEPICGEVAQDIPQTAQGVWFVKGTVETYPEDPHTSLVHDRVDPTTPVFSIGNTLLGQGISPGVYNFTPRTSGLIDRDFKDVASDGQIYCYNLPGLGGKPGWQLILQMPDPSTLKLEKRTCGSGFTSSAIELER